MCLYTNKKEPHVAKEPIYVYKILLKEKHKPFKWLPFIKVTKYITPYYKTLVKNRTLIANDINKPLLECDRNIFAIDAQGVHAYVSKNLIRNYNYIFGTNVILTLWKIPEGTKYWIGNDNLSNYEIAAQKMKFIKEIH